jgi:heme A synthase
MTSITGLSHDASLLVFALIAVVGLILLIARFKLNAFVALILASLFVGLCAGMGLLEIVTSFQEGVGAMLGSIAIVIGLGTILGKCWRNREERRSSPTHCSRRWANTRSLDDAGVGFVVGITVGSALAWFC